MGVKKAANAALRLAYAAKRSVGHLRFLLFRQRVQQAIVNTAETAVAHHQNVVARLCGFHHHVHQRVEIRAPMRRLHAGIRHFRDLPRNVVRLEQEHFVGTAERRRQIVLLMPIFMVLDRGSSTARMRAVPPTLPRSAARVARIAVGWCAKSS